MTHQASRILLVPALGERVGEAARVADWVLSTVDIGALADSLALPSLPYPLDVPSPGVTYEERRHHVEAVLADLAGQRFDALRDALVLLAFGEFVVDGRLAAGRRLDLVGAVRGDRAALAVQAGDTVRVSLVHGGALVGLIVDLLPPVRQLAGNSTTVPQDALRNALTEITRSGDFLEFERILTDAGVRGRDVRSLAELVRADGAAAQFGVARRDPATDTSRDRRVWTWYASESGGVLLGLGSDASPAWTTFVPANPARVGQYLAEALYGLRYGGVRDVRG